MVTTLSGVGNIVKFRHLANVAKVASRFSKYQKASKFASTISKIRLAAGAIEISSGSLNILLKLTELRETPFGQALTEYLFYLELLSLSGELTLAIHNGLRKSARKLVEKPEDAAKLEKQLDNLVEEGQVTRRDADEVIKELRRVTNESLALGKSRLFRVQGGDIKPNISKFRFIFRNSKLEIIGKDRLHITFNDVERAIEFYIKRGDKAEVFTANINKSFLDKIKSEAVKQNKAKKYPTRPN